jgi:hypothetical protein
MRRLFLMTVLVGLMGVAVGCSHTAGVCDCDYTGPCGTAAHAHVAGHHGGGEPALADGLIAPVGLAAPAGPAAPAAPVAPIDQVH